MDVALAKEAVEVSKQAVEDAKEHLRLAEQMHKVGMGAFVRCAEGASLSFKGSRELRKG